MSNARPADARTLAEATGLAVGKHVREKLEPLEARIAALEVALEGLQRKSLADAFCGGWLAGCLYKRGSLVQHDGQLYLALAPTDEKPGSTASWRSILDPARRGR